MVITTLQSGLLTCFLTPFVLCVLNFIHKWRDLQLKVDSEVQIFWETSCQFLFTLRVFARNLLRWNLRRNAYSILFWCLAWGSNPGFSSNKPTHYLLDHGDFDAILKAIKEVNTKFLKFEINIKLFLYILKTFKKTPKQKTCLLCPYLNFHIVVFAIFMYLFISFIVLFT